MQTATVIWDPPMLTPIAEVRTMRRTSAQIDDFISGPGYVADYLLVTPWGFISFHALRGI